MYIYVGIYIYSNSTYPDASCKYYSKGTDKCNDKTLTSEIKHFLCFNGPCSYIVCSPVVRDKDEQQESQLVSMGTKTMKNGWNSSTQLFNKTSRDSSNGNRYSKIKAV